MIPHSPTPAITTVNLRPAKAVSHVLYPVQLVNISICNTQERLVLPAARFIWRVSSPKYHVSLDLEWN